MTFTSKARAVALASARGQVANATAREQPSVPLKEVRAIGGPVAPRRVGRSAPTRPPSPVSEVSAAGTRASRCTTSPGVATSSCHHVGIASVVSSPSRASITASGSRSNSAAMSSMPAPPSMNAWWNLATTGTVPSAIPSSTCISHRALRRSSGLAARTPVAASTSLQVAPAGRVVRLTWSTGSKSGSSIHRSAPRPPGGSTRRHRSGGRAGRRARTTSRIRSRTSAADRSPGSRTNTPVTCSSIERVSARTNMVSIPPRYLTTVPLPRLVRPGPWSLPNART